MKSDDLRACFGKLHIWHANGQRAPNKPLLVLWAIGRCLAGESRMVSYRVANPELASLLRRFGPPRKTIHTEFPFWRLQSDGIWEIRHADRITVGPGGDAHKASLIEHDAHGGFTNQVFTALQTDPELAIEVAYSLIDAHFPDTRHDDILEAVGVATRRVCVRRRPRDSSFAKAVLAAYRHRCAVCAFAVRLDDNPVALEAAHIKWHGARGPDQIRNALALCALHHRLFDAGAFTLSLGRRVVVTDTADGRGFDDCLGRFDSRPIFLPARADNLPDPLFLKWHHREVFAGPVKSTREFGPHAQTSRMPISATSLRPPTPGRLDPTRS